MMSDSPFFASGDPPLALTAPSPAGFHGPGYVPSPAARALGGGRVSPSATRSGDRRRRRRRDRSSSALVPRLADQATLGELEAQARTPLDPSLSALFAVDGAARLDVPAFEGEGSNRDDASTPTPTTDDSLPLLPLAPHPSAEDSPRWLEGLLWSRERRPRELRVPSVVAGYQGDWLEVDAAGAGAAFACSPSSDPLEPCSNPKPVVAAVVCPSEDAPAASRFVFGEVGGRYEGSRLGSHSRVRGLPGGGGGVFSFGGEGDGGGGEGATVGGAAARLRAALRLAAASSCWQGAGGGGPGAGGGSLDGGGRGPEPHLVVYVVPPPASLPREGGDPSSRRSYADSPRSALAALLDVSAALRDRATAAATAAALAPSTAAAQSDGNPGRKQRPLRATLQLVPRSALASLSHSLPASESAARAARAVAFAVFSKLPSAPVPSSSTSKPSDVVPYEPLMFLAGEAGRDGAGDGEGEDDDDVAAAGRTLHCCYLPVGPPPPFDKEQRPSDDENVGDRARGEEGRLVAVAWTDSRGKLLDARAVRVPLHTPTSAADGASRALSASLASAVLSETARFRARAAASAERAAREAAASFTLLSSSRRRRRRPSSSSSAGDAAAASASPDPSPATPPPPLRRILVSRLGTPHPAEAAAWRDLLGFCDDENGDDGGGGGQGGGEAVAAVALSFDPPFRLARAADAPGFPFLAIEEAETATGAAVVFPPPGGAPPRLPSGPAASVEADSARALRLRLLGGASSSSVEAPPSSPEGFLRWAGSELAALSSLAAATEVASLSLPGPAGATTTAVPAGLSPGAHLPVHAAAALRLARLCEAARLR